ncbi:ABC transporter substrate-binding protein [candidate division KSB1 bacterium]
MNLPKPAERIVSLIPSITETLFELGLEEKIVGITDYCIKPGHQVDLKEKIGGPKNPDINKILDLRPDLIIANIEENREKDVKLLEEKGIGVFVTFPRTVDESLELIKTLGDITGSIMKGDQLYKKALEIKNDISDKVVTLKRKPGFVYLIWRKPYMTVSTDTFISNMLEFCGGVNLNKGQEGQNRYPKLKLEDILHLKPDIIFLPSEPFNFTEKHISDFSSHKDIPAVKNNRIELVDGELVSWYGIRMIYGLPYIWSFIENYSESN